MRKYIVLLGVLVSIVCAATWWRPALPQPTCRVTMLDVGQGDAILIQTNDHQDILIDGGPDDGVLRGLGKYLPAGDRDIELMVLTHPHADHVNGLVSVTERYTVRRVLETGVRYTQSAYLRWHELLRQHRVPISAALAGTSLRVGAARLDVLWPATSLQTTTITSDDAAQGGGVNDASIVLRLVCGGSHAMLMGDASSDIEQRILDRGEDVRSGLLKVGHHGSRFSTSMAFVQAVHPAWALISVGLNNRYHHPHPTTLLRLQQLVPHIVRTDVGGAFQLKSDGHGGWITGVDKLNILW